MSCGLHAGQCTTVAISVEDCGRHTSGRILGRPQSAMHRKVKFCDVKAGRRAAQWTGTISESLDVFVELERTPLYSHSVRLTQQLLALFEPTFSSCVWCLLSHGMYIHAPPLVRGSLCQVICFVHERHGHWLCLYLP